MKKQNFSKLAAFGLALVLVSAGCSNGLKQDPYADQPDNVKNAGPLAPKPKEAPPTSVRSDYLLIQSPDSLEFKEGEELRTTIKGVVLTDVNGHKPVLGVDYEFSIENMSDFPRASFDPTTGEFKWAPRPGFVDKAYTRNVHIDATLTTKGADPLKTSKTIIGVITRTEVDPTIVSIDDLKTTPTKEGETRDFKVTVRDPHGDAKSANTKPRLSILSVDSGMASAAGYIYCKGNNGCSDPSVDPTDSTLFTFNLTLDLQGKEITKNQALLSFGVVATSRFGEASAVTKASVSVITNVNDTEMSWSDAQPINVVAGQQNTVNFTVYDPVGDGNITATFVTRCDQVLGTDAVCECKSQAGSAAQLCTISWMLPALPAQPDYSILVSSLNESKIDKSVKTTIFTARTLHVIQPSPSGPGSGPFRPYSTHVNAVSVSGGHQ